MHEDEGSAEKVWEYMYEGACGCTWPLRWFRVEKRGEGEGVEDLGEEELEIKFLRKEGGLENEEEGMEFEAADHEGRKCGMHGVDVNDEMGVLEIEKDVVQPRKLKVKVRRYLNEDGVVKARFRYAGRRRSAKEEADKRREARGHGDAAEDVQVRSEEWERKDSANGQDGSRVEDAFC